MFEADYPVGLGSLVPITYLIINANISLQSIFMHFFFYTADNFVKLVVDFCIISVALSM